MKQSRIRFIALFCAGSALLQAVTTATATASSQVQPPALLQGHASETQSLFDSAYKAGTKALNEHQYLTAEQRLTAAAEELRKHNITDDRYVQTKIALGWVYMGLEKPHTALHLFEEMVPAAVRIGDDTAQGSSLAGLAEALAKLGNARKAQPIARRAITVNEPLHQSGYNTRELGRSYIALGISCARLGFDDEALASFKKAVSIFERHPGFEHTDLADALRGVADEYLHQGKPAESKEASAQMFEILDQQVKLDRSPSQASKIYVDWTAGGLRSRQLYDPDYPLKYVWINGLRVAATLVRSENVIGALISLSNCSRSRMELCLGRVELEELAPQKKQLAYVLPVKLDMALEEEHICSLTWRRPWLNHIEKTRRIPGYLRDGMLDVDNFFANNTFGAYGNWGSIAETRTPLVTREQMLYGFMGQKKVGDLASFLSCSGGAQATTYLEPGDSKTGLVFFGHERFNQAKLKIPVGNLVVELPFDSAGPR